MTNPSTDSVFIYRPKSLPVTDKSKSLSLEETFQTVSMDLGFLQHLQFLIMLKM